MTVPNDANPTENAIWIDGEWFVPSLDEATIPVRRQQAIDRLWAKFRRWEGAPDYSKKPMAQSIRSNLGDLRARQEELLVSLERGEAWLQDHDDGPKNRNREDQWLSWLKEHNAVADALIVIGEALDAREQAA